jgi:hypothetical protein
VDLKGQVELVEGKMVAKVFELVFGESVAVFGDGFFDLLAYDVYFGFGLFFCEVLIGLGVVQVVVEGVFFVSILFDDARAEVFVGMANYEGVRGAEVSQQVALVPEEVGAGGTLSELGLQGVSEIADAVDKFGVQLEVVRLPM